ncbi:hypothetical protein LOK49_LG02G02241 [Camellia lanceoleosa]|uniref:Uncharacterized protein n=1 Tax=Camellia lanceoleosa TaxID=1840588 RepID=A0ACC0IKK2_9ERIC|nr:hypothetical protein LOK49_LG02G02241 [Camellia lanceoleosa]
MLQHPCWEDSSPNSKLLQHPLPGRHHATTPTTENTTPTDHHPLLKTQHPLPPQPQINSHQVFFPLHSLHRNTPTAQPPPEYTHCRSSAPQPPPERPTADHRPRTSYNPLPLQVNTSTATTGTPPTADPNTNQQTYSQLQYYI